MSVADNFISQEASIPNANRFALLVGINNSTSALSYQPKLKYAEKDAEDMAYLLKQPACNFRLMGPALLGEKATASNIKQSVIDLVMRRTEQDFLLFYFAGHATPINNEIYFITHDFQEDRVEVDHNFYLSMRWLWEKLYMSKGAGRVLLILDCCYAGNMVDTKDDPLQIDLRRLLEDWDTGSSSIDQKNCLRLILTATGNNIEAQELDGHGLMTGLILKALRGEEPDVLDEEGHVEIRRLHTYLQKKMPKGQLPDLAGKFGPYNCILASHPKLSPRKRSDADRAIENTLIDITDPNFFKRLVEAAYTSRQVRQFDQVLQEDASISDLNLEKVTAFFKRDRVQRQDDFDRQSTDPADQLRNFELLQKSYPTSTALLCFGLKPTKWVTGAFTRCTHWNGQNRDKGMLEDQEYRGDLIQQFESGSDFLRKTLRLVRVIGRDERSEGLEIPLVALQEALANALMHRAYENQWSPVYVDVFQDRIEISSPGLPPEPMTLELLEEEHKSHPRNPQIARIFYLYGYVESVGSGIPAHATCAGKSRIVLCQV